MHFLTSKTDDVRYLDRSQWSDQREHLIRFYKNKIRRLDSNLAGLRKRPLETADQADHFFSAQAAAVSASKKPRKKFYKKKSSLWSSFWLQKNIKKMKSARRETHFQIFFKKEFAATLVPP